jgi:hypothetical protein
VLLLLASLAFASPSDDLARWAASLPVAQAQPDKTDGYRFMGPLFTSLAQRAVERPGVVTVERIGESTAGHPIWAFHVDEPASETTGEAALVFAGIHALEWISVEVAATLLVELIEHPVRGRRVTVIPVLNPDGRLKTESDLAAGDNTYRRGNGPNVDLNRDFAVHREVEPVWSRLLPKRYGTSPAPLSQPESQALDGLLEREHYARAASLHAFGGYIYAPWSGRWRRPEAWPAHLALGRAMEAAQGDHAYRTRQLARWGFFFRARGTEVDHLHGEHGITAFLVELTRSGWDPRHPFRSTRDYFRWYNPVRPERHVDRGLAALRVLVGRIKVDSDP